MVESLRLVNFKCFGNQQILFKPLTLLSGLNSSGKSTIIQSLLVLRQSYLENLLPADGLTLNGKLIQLGTARDILFEEADEDQIKFELAASGGEKLQLRFDYKEASDVLNVSKCEASPNIWATSLFTDDFQYISAERLGPRTAFPMSDYEVRHHRQLGRYGEFTAHFLSLFGDSHAVHERMMHPNATSKQLKSQIEAWMTEISPGVRLEFKRRPEMDLVTFSVSYAFGHKVSSAEYRPTNVGFGITYGLPVVVALLAARPGAIIVLENPEAHLHPRGQVKVGELMCLAAASGIQVVVETHSDHILNGIRLAAIDRKLRSNDVGIYHGRWTPGASSPSMTPIEVDERGRLSSWPDGFFDEIERSLDRLLDPGE